MPISDKQLAANRANAQKSTGPRTPAGKSRSARNARKHGFSGEAFSIVRIEDRDAVDRLRADLLATYQPINSQETFALERLALAQHSLLRLARLEAGLGTTALDGAISFIADEPVLQLHEALQSPPEEVREQNRVYCFALGFDQSIRRSPATWSLFLRYQAQAERLYRRAVEDLDRLIKLRPLLPPPLPEESPIDDSPNEAISETQNDENTNNSAPEIEAVFTLDAPTESAEPPAKSEASSPTPD